MMFHQTVRECWAKGVFIAAVVVAVLGILPAVGAAGEPTVRAVTDKASGQIDLWEGDRPVLRYNYQTVQPPEGFLQRVAEGNRKYARPRSNYIHPLYGLDGQALTADWSQDHPHHRGIYWAWPEVDYRSQRGDLHALQLVFARPTGQVQTRTAADYAEIEAENLWKWEDRTAIVRETATIRAWRSGEHGRFVDLVFRFCAIEDDVALARRGMAHYGGLNIRLAPIKNMKLVHHTDAAKTAPRRAWAEAGGVWGGSDQPAGLAALEHASNPGYPGDWIEYPYLPWFQPTFPTAGTRFVLKKDQPLELKYRLWIRRGAAPAEEVYQQQWQAYQNAGRR